MTPKEPLSPAWTPEDRIRVALAMVPLLREAFRLGRYLPGKPNLTGLAHVLAAPAAELEEARAWAEDLVAGFERGLAEAKAS